MDAKKLYKKHLDRHTPKGIWISQRHWEHIKLDATLTAIEEALNYAKNTESR